MLTPTFRVSYPALLKPKYNELAKKDQYSLVMLFDKKTAAKDLKDLKEAVARIAKEKWPKGLPRNFRTPFRDGDTETYDKGARQGEAKAPGCIFINSKSDQAPGVMKFDELGKKVKVLNEDDVYGGCYAIAEVSVFAYDKVGNCGVSIGLNHILKMKEGERFSKRASMESAFAAVDAQESQAEEVDGLGLPGIE